MHSIQIKYLSMSATTMQSLRQSMIAGNSFISQNNYTNQMMNTSSNAGKLTTDYQKLKNDLVNKDTDDKTIALLLQVWPSFSLTKALHLLTVFVL